MFGVIRVYLGKVSDFCAVFQFYSALIVRKQRQTCEKNVIRMWETCDGLVVDLLLVCDKQFHP